MSAGSWESFFEVGQWPAQVAASVGIFVLTAILFYVISLFVRHALATPSDADPSEGLRRGRIATAVVMAIGLLVAGQASGLFGSVNIVPAGISLLGSAIHAGGTVAAAALIAAGLAAGFGAKELVVSAVLGVYFRSKWGKEHGLPEIGARVAIGDTEGELTQVSPLYAHIRTADGATVFVPTARVVADGIKHQAEEAPPSDEPASPLEPEPEAPGAPEERRSIFD